MASLNLFKDNFKGGTRQNRFLVTGSFPSGGGTTSNSSNANTTGGAIPFHIRSTLIPTLQTSTIAYDYYGRKLYYPGEKLYSTWSVSIVDDTDSGDLWKKFHRWHTYINEHVTNTTKYPTTSNYKVNWYVEHLGLNENVLKRFHINGLWPRTINEMSLSMSRPNVLNTFNVVFVYDTISIDGITQRDSL
jgi:hypothetical protein